MNLSVKDRILQLSKGTHKCGLLKIDFNKYVWGEWRYEHEIVNFYVNGRKQSDISRIKVSKDELLEVCNLFIKGFISGEDVQLICVRNSNYENGFIPFGVCSSPYITPMSFSRNANSIINSARNADPVMDFSLVQHFQFKLSSQKSELCGFVHSFEALNELTKNMASSLGGSRIKTKMILL